MTTLKKAVSRMTIATLGGNFGSDRGRRIAVTLCPGRCDDSGKHVPDLIELRPERTKRAERVALVDVYHYAIRCRVNMVRLEKANAVKKKKAEARSRRRMMREIRKENAQ